MSVPHELIMARHESSFRTSAAGRVDDTTVAVIGGQIAGFVMVVDNEVKQLYVSALHRGEGVADEPMADAERRINSALHHNPFPGPQGSISGLGDRWVGRITRLYQLVSRSLSSCATALSGAWLRLRSGDG